MATTVFSVGHSHHAVERMIGLLRQHGICTVVDVRSRPYSKWAPQYKKEALARWLRGAGVDYVFMGRELGGKLDDEYRDGSGRVDYARRASAADFQAGLDRLIGLAGTQPTAILCAEEDPEHCHRHLLIAPALADREVAVAHIRADGRLQSEQDLRDASPQLELFR